MLSSFKIVKKDLILAFKYDIQNCLILLFPLFISIFITSSNFKAGISEAVLFTVYVIVTSSFSKEEAANTSMIIKSLPVNIKNIIIGKYIFTALIILVAALISSIYPAFISITRNNHVYLSTTFTNFITYITLSMFLFSILFPIIYKFAYSKIHFITIIFYLLLIFSPVILTIFNYISIMEPSTADLIKKIDNVIENLSSLFIECLILYVLSMTVSIKIYS